MKVLLNEQGYVESYALEGDLLDAVETAEPDDLSHFEEHFTAYQVRDGTMVLMTPRPQRNRRKPQRTHTESGGKSSAFPSSTGGSFGTIPSRRNSSRN